MANLIVTNSLEVRELNRNRWAQIVVTLDEPSDERVSFRYFTVEGTAEEDRDFEGIGNKRVTFRPGQVRKTIKVRILGDREAESSESFKVKLFDIRGASLDEDEIDINIIDDEATTPPLTDRPTDLRVDIRTQNNLSAGQTFSVGLDIFNDSNIVAGNSQVMLFLSKDENIDSSDFRLGELVDVSSIPAGNSSNISVDSLTLPEATNSFWEGNGFYYVGAMVDPSQTIPETDNNNNIGFAAIDVTGIEREQITYEGNLLVTDYPSSLNGSDTDGSAGSSSNVEVTTYNDSDNVSPTTEVSIYLSQDDYLDTNSDYLLGTFPFPQILPIISSSLQTRSETYEVTYPASGDPFWVSDGNYFLFAVIDPDNLILETNEDDNLISTGINIGGTQLGSTSGGGSGGTVPPPGGDGGSTFNPGEPYERCYPNPATLEGEIICETIYP